MKVKVNTTSTRMEKSISAETIKSAKVIATKNELNSHKSELAIYKKKLKKTQHLNIGLIVITIILVGILGHQFL